MRDEDVVMVLNRVVEVHFGYEEEVLQFVIWGPK